MCYRDTTFCPFYTKCKYGDKCNRKLSSEVKEGAKKWWGLEDEPPICIYLEEPDCYCE